jgi:hypothetical protein
LGQAQQGGEIKSINWMPIPISAKTEKTCTYSLPLKNVTRYRSQKMNDNINTDSKIAASANMMLFALLILMKLLTITA